MQENRSFFPQKKESAASKVKAGHFVQSAGADNNGRKRTRGSWRSECHVLWKFRGTGHPCSQVQSARSCPFPFARSIGTAQSALPDKKDLSKRTGLGGSRASIKLSAQTAGGAIMDIMDMMDNAPLTACAQSSPEK